MKIQSIVTVPVSRALAALHTGRDFLKAIPKIYWVAALGISLLAGIYHRFCSGRKGTLPLITVENDSFKEEISFEDGLMRYQKLNALLEIIKDLKNLINSEVDNEDIDISISQKVKILYENWDYFKKSLLEKDQVDPCGAFVISPIKNYKIEVLTLTEGSIKAAQKDLQKVLDEKKPKELNGISFPSGYGYSREIYYCESLRKQLGKTVEKQFYPRLFFDKHVRVYKESLPSSGFIKFDWKQIILVPKPLQPDLKEVVILSEELPLLTDLGLYQKLPGNILIDNFTADQKTINELIYSKI